MKIVTKIKHLPSLFALCLSSTAFAGTMGPPVVDPQWTTVLTLSAGPIWASASGTQSVYFSPELSRTYTIDSQNNPLVYGEIFIGAQRNFNSRFESQFGVAIAGANSLKISGDIWDFEDPRFDNYSDFYSIQHSYIALKGKVLTNAAYSFKPWISGSIGIGINKAKNYTVIPKICEVIPLSSANFSDHRTTSFGYTLGAGVQRELTQHWQIGVGYEFADWGKSQLGRAPAQPAGSYGLTLEPLYSNGLLFNLTWLA